MNLAFLSLQCWLDGDGKHVWQSHECKDGQTVESMLPNPPWRVLGSPFPGLPAPVEPSIICDRCGLHAFGKAEARP